MHRQHTVIAYFYSRCRNQPNARVDEDMIANLNSAHPFEHSEPNRGIA